MVQNNQDQKRIKVTKSVIVIAAGIREITLAIHLTQKGYRVTIIEKNSYPGTGLPTAMISGHLAAKRIMDTEN